LVVIAVIGILAAGVLAVIDPIAQMRKGEDGRRKADLKQIQTGLELYRSDLGNYPSVYSGNSVQSPLRSPDNSITYMQNVPKDPNGINYYYAPYNSNRSYYIYACAKNVNDLEAITSGPSGYCPSGSKFYRYSSP